jgi:hypothetical protein
MPPDTCPEGTLPVATASNQGQVTPEPTLKPTPTPTEPPVSTVEPTTEAATPTVEPTTTSTYVQSSLPTENATIPSTPTFSQVPIGAGSSLKAIGLGLVAVVPAVLMNWL